MSVRIGRLFAIAVVWLGAMGAGTSVAAQTDDVAPSPSAPGQATPDAPELFTPQPSLASSPPVGLSPAAPAAAPAPVEAHFTAHGDAFTLTAPPGLCTPLPSAAQEMSRLTATMASANATVGAMFALCPGVTPVVGQPAVAFIAIGNQQKLLVERQVFLRAVLASLHQAAGRQLLDQSVQKGLRMDKSLGGPVASQVGEPRVLGMDPYGVYIQTDLCVMVANRQTQALAIEAMTLVKGDLVVYLFTSRRGTDADGAALLAQLQLQTRRFVEANSTPAKHTASAAHRHY